MHQNSVAEVSATGAAQGISTATALACVPVAMPSEQSNDEMALLPCTKPIANLPPLPPSQLDTLVKILQHRALHQSQDRAFTFLQDGENGESHLTFGDLDRRARAVGAELAKRGMRQRRVLLMLDPSLDYNAALFGCLYCGAVAVPVYPPDPFRAHRTLPRLEAVVRDAEAALVLTSREMLVWARSLACSVGNAAVLAVEDIAPETAWQPEDIAGDDLAILQYTSGSTGSPRGVMITHSNIMHNCRSLHRIDSDGVVVVSWLPPYHDMGLIGCLLLPVHSGRWVVQMAPLSFAQKPLRWLRAISKYQAKTSAAPNFGYELCIRKIGNEECFGLDLGSWTKAVSGAEPVRAETVDRFCEKFAPYGFRRDAFYPAYGMAEGTLLIAGGHRDEPPVEGRFSAAGLAQGRAEPPLGAEDTRRLIGCGCPVLNGRLLIVDPQTRRSLPPGQVGEVWTLSPSTGKGYWNRPEETAYTFQARLDEPGSGCYLRTGDLGFVARENVFLTGRLKERIILGGKNYYPQDIEQMVEVAHTALRVGGCAAFSIDSEGQEGLVIVAEVLRPKRQNLDEIIASIRQELAAESELAPIAVMLIASGSLPKTSSGKTRRLACKAMFLEGGLTVQAEWRAGESFGSVQTAANLFQTQEEERLARLWAEVLGVTEIGRDADFLEMGGHSLRAAQLAARISEEFGCEILLQTLFEHPTIARFAAWLSAQPSIPTATMGYRGPIAVLAADSPAPLSSAESRLWFFDRLEPGNPYYNMPVAARLRGPLDLDRFTLCLNLLAVQHDTLRTTYMEKDGRSIRRISPKGTIPSRFVDLQAIPIERREAELAARLAADAGEPFDLGQGPLVRAVIYRLSAEEHAVLLAMHHIVVDGFSVGILAHELGELYGRQAIAVESRPAAAGNRTTSLSYADYARWEASRRNAPDLTRELDWWKHQLAGSATPVSPPGDRPRPVQQSFAGALRPWELSAEISSKIRALAAAQHVTPFAIFLAALNIFLARVCRQNDISVGTVTANRPRRELESVVGFFANTLVLRTQLEGEPSFVELARKVSHETLEALGRQSAPFDRVVEAVRPARRSDQAPLFRTALVLENMPLALDALSGLRVEPIAVDTGTSKYDLALLMSERGGRFIGHAEYATAIYDAPTIDRIVESLTTLLNAALENPQQSIWRLPLVDQAFSAAEDHSKAATAPSREGEGALLHGLFQRQARQSPERIALSAAEGVVTYGELRRRADWIARHLAARGIEPEKPVAVCLPRGCDLVAAMLGVLSSGGVYVPIDPSLPPQRVATVLDDIRPMVIVTRRSLIDTILKDRPGVLAIEGLFVECPKEVVLPVVRGENLAYILFTSGSTGRPKGAMIEHRGAASFISAFVQRLGITERCRVLQSFAPASDGSISDCFAALAAGATLVVPQADATRDPARLEAILRDEKVSVATLTPSLMHILRPEGLSDLRVVCAVGEPLDESLARRWAIDRRLINGYGVTEASVGACLMDVVPSDVGRPAIGHPLDGVRIRILDEHLEALPLGMPGEICIGGIQVGRGYWNAPELTSQSFLADRRELSDNGRLYRTGDLGRQRADGTIEFLGRIDDQVKVRGHRVEPGEITTMLENHPSVARAAVVMREVRPNRQQLVAYVVPGNGALDTGQLREYLRTRLPQEMLPAVFVPMDSLPQTDHGKLDRAALPSPSELDALRPVEPIAPRDAEEALIASVWEDVLGVRFIGATDDFFALGGHSLLAVQVIGEIERRTGRRLPLAAMFSDATVERLAHLLRAPHGVQGGDCLVSLAVGGAGRPLFFIHPAGGTVFCYRELARHLSGTRPCYGVQAVGVDGTSCPLERIDEMARHYSALIRQAQSDGPYLLVGWSLGGNLAFETARQLSQQDADVAMVALLDAAALPADKEPSLEQFLPMAMDFFPDEENLSLESLERLSWHEQLEYFVRRAGQAELVLGGEGVESGRHVFEVFRAGMRAILTHRQHPYEGAVTLFAADHDPRLFPAASDPLFGWGALARGGVEVHHVSGNHVRMVLDPHAKLLAECLAECLARAEAAWPVIAPTVS